MKQIMEFLLKIFVLTKNSAEHQSNVPPVQNLCLTYSPTKEVIHDSLWENKMAKHNRIYSFLVSKHKYLARLLLLEDTLSPAVLFLEKDYVCSSINLIFCCLSHVTEESR